eukprot:TRINITY_DN51131_c0_g1_i1.p1 TRINITY_DN51131_c0_g1~~TRINITY_DN51131_c0_g1_i1.p1  ORF type:complete len:834 (+),score=103.57 TRINITY_DN51131_c0_g1_i1:77-2578(+)
MSESPNNSSQQWASTVPAGNKFDLIVVGAGSGGNACAKRASKMYGKKVLLLDATFTGGACVSVGCVLKKILHGIASFKHHAYEASYEGWNTAGKDFKLDFAWTIQRVREIIASMNDLHYNNNLKAGVDMRHGHAKLLGNGKVEVTKLPKAEPRWHVGHQHAAQDPNDQFLNPRGETEIYEGDAIIVATGGRAITLDVPGSEFCDTSLEVFFQWKELPKKIFVIGGGCIGVEFACVLNAMGADVTIVIRGQRLLSSLDSAMVEFLEARMINRGLKIMRNTQASKFEKSETGKGMRITFTDGTVHECDKVVQAVGRAPNVENLGLDLAGVQLGEKGPGNQHPGVNVWTHEDVKKDPKKILYQSVSNPTVLCLGGLIDKGIQLTPVAAAQGFSLIDNLYRNKNFSIIHASYDLLPSAIFSLPECGICGLNEKQAVDKFGKDNIVTKTFNFGLGQRPLVPAEIKENFWMKLVFKINGDRITGNEEVLGCMMCLDGAGEMIQFLSIGMLKGLTKRDLDLTMALHSSGAEELVTIYGEKWSEVADNHHVRQPLKEHVLNLAAGQTFDADRAKAFEGMDLNSDKKEEVLFRFADHRWIETEAGGVFRMPIERIGSPYTRVTTTVKFEPNRRFPGHVHGGGEEFIVIAGAWADCFSKGFPKYSYIRNYIGSKHSPLIGKDGCVIMVKLRHMSENHVEPNHRSWYAPPPHVNRNEKRTYDQAFPDCNIWDQLPSGGFKRMLYQSPNERVSVEYFPKDVTSFDIDVPKNGKEIYIVDGSFKDKLGDHDEWSWARYVKPGKHQAEKPAGTELYIYIKDDQLNSHEVGTRKIDADDLDYGEVTIA